MSTNSQTNDEMIIVNVSVDGTLYDGTLTYQPSLSTSISTNINNFKDSLLKNVSSLFTRKEDANDVQTKINDIDPTDTKDNGLDEYINIGNALIEILKSDSFKTADLAGRNKLKNDVENFNDLVTQLPQPSSLSRDNFMNIKYKKLVKLNARIQKLYEPELQMENILGGKTRRKRHRNHLRNRTHNINRRKKHI